MIRKSTLERLVREHHRAAFLWACQCCRNNQEDAKEVLQATYLKLFEGRANYRKQASFKTWLFAVIRFTAIDYLKRKRKFESLDNLQIPEMKYTTTTINGKALLARLPARQQQVLLLAFYHGMSLSQIAEVTELHIGTVRTHYERGKAALRALIINQEV